jgi:hypothetical protein
MHGCKPFWELETFADSPKLPHGYHLMSFIALHGPSWRRRIDPLLADWDRRLANEVERSLVRERGWAIDGSIFEQPTEHSCNPKFLPYRSTAETGLPH